MERIWFYSAVDSFTGTISVFEADMSRWCLHSNIFHQQNGTHIRKKQNKKAVIIRCYKMQNTVQCTISVTALSVAEHIALTDEVFGSTFGHRRRWAADLHLASAPYRMLMRSTQAAAILQWTVDIEPPDSARQSSLMRHRAMKFGKAVNDCIPEVTNSQTSGLLNSNNLHNCGGALALISILLFVWKSSSAMLAVPAENAGTDSAYEQIRAIHRKAKRPCRRPGRRNWNIQGSTVYFAGNAPKIWTALAE